MADLTANTAECANFSSNEVNISCLVIAKRRIGFSPKCIKQHIDNSDISELSSEFAELLLKFVPTKEEVKTFVHPFLSLDSPCWSIVN